MNVIFLDIDGVLNSSAYFRMIKKDKYIYKKMGDISDFHLKQLAQIYHTCDARIVLTSTWRVLEDGNDSLCQDKYHYLVQCLRKYGMGISSKTAVINQNRPAEIRAWLDKRKETETMRFVILDDDFSRGKYDEYGLGQYLVKTRFFCEKLSEGGLQPVHVNEAILMLKSDLEQERRHK